MSGGRSALTLEVTNGCNLFAGLRRFGIASELTLYDEGHVFSRPAAVADSLARMGDWFDFWLKGREDSVPEKTEQYRRWRHLRDSAPAPH